MSFSARLGSTNLHRRRPFDRPQRAPARPTLGSEDAQPNELLDKKRNSGAPPTVIASAPTPRQGWKDAGRGGTNPRSRPYWGTNSGPGSHVSRSPGPLHLHPLPGCPSSGTSGRSSLTEVKRPWASPAGPPSAAGSVSSAPRMSQSMSNISPSSVVPASLNAERPSSRTNQRGGHPLPDSTATSLDANSSPSSKSQKRSRKRRKHSSQPGTHALPRVRTGMSQESIRRTPSTQDGSLQRPLTPPDTPTVDSSSVLASASSSSQENTSASALLLNDLGMPAAQTNPPAKRRKVASTQPPPPSAPIRSSRSNGHGIAPVPLPGSQSGPVSVKRERSPSPPLARLVTQGCVRVAPLPPNCRKTHSGYQAARQELAKAEMDKIRKLGLHPTRVFTREDGMVIDWKSDIPVLPDTLRPPYVEQQRAAEKVAARPEKERDAPRTRAAQQSRAPESRPRADTQDEAMVQDYLFRASPVVREDAAQSVASPSAEVHMRQHTSQVPAQKPSDREKRPNLHVVNQLFMQMDVIDLTEDDDGITPIVDQSFSGTASRPASSAAYDDTGPNSIPASSHAVLSNGSGSGSRPTPNTITAPNLDTSNRASLPRTVSIASDNSEVDEMEAAALDFLKKYMIAFSEDRAVLVRAYSRMATLSIITPSDSPITPSSRQTPYQGRADIVSALLALPDEQALYDEDGEGMAEVDWDLVYVEATGDVLLICYATHDRSPGAKTNEKGKGKRRADRWAYEQRFLLRRREWDVEDRDTPGLWPLVAVSHQMTIKPLWNP